MRRLSKSAEPRELVEYRSQQGDPNLSLENFDGLERLRKQLLADQGYLCCYCMSRVEIGRMKIEHLLSQADHDDARLAWRNLLAACPGNEGRAPAEQHCDTRKGKRHLQLHPFSPEVARIKYASDGSVRIDDAVLQRDLDDVLNLNQRDLKGNRKQALAALLTELTDARTGAHWSASTLQRKLETLRAAPRLRPYLGVIEAWLELAIRRRSKA